MNIFNRFIVILGILLTIVAVTTVLIFPESSLDTISFSASTLLKQMARILPDWIMVFRLVLAGIAVVVDFLLLWLLVAEFRGPRPRWIRVPGVNGGRVDVRTDSIASRLRYHIDPLPDVLSVKPNVTPKRGGVALSLEVQTLSEINVPRKAEEILEVAREVIENKMGLKLADKPQVMIRTVYPPEGAPGTALQTTALQTTSAPATAAILPGETPSAAQTPEPGLPALPESAEEPL